MDDLKPQPSAVQVDGEVQAAIDLAAVLRLPQGRRVLLSILGRCGVYRSAFTGDEANTNKLLGEQSIGLWLIMQLEQVGPTEYPQLLLSAARDRGMTEEAVHVLDEE